MHVFFYSLLFWFCFCCCIDRFEIIYPQQLLIIHNHVFHIWSCWGRCYLLPLCLSGFFFTLSLSLCLHVSHSFFFTISKSTLANSILTHGRLITSRLCPALPCLPLDFISVYTLIYFNAPFSSLQLQYFVNALNSRSLSLSEPRKCIAKISQPVELWISSINIYRLANAWLLWIIIDRVALLSLFFFSLFSAHFFPHLLLACFASIYISADLITGCRCAPVQLVLFFQNLCCFHCCKCLGALFIHHQRCVCVGLSKFSLVFIIIISQWKCSWCCFRSILRMYSHNFQK